MFRRQFCRVLAALGIGGACAPAVGADPDDKFSFEVVPYGSETVAGRASGEVVRSADGVVRIVSARIGNNTTVYVMKGGTLVAAEGVHISECYVYGGLITEWPTVRGPA